MAGYIAESFYKEQLERLGLEFKKIELYSSTIPISTFIYALDAQNGVFLPLLLLDIANRETGQFLFQMGERKIDRAGFIMFPSNMDVFLVEQGSSEVKQQLLRDYGLQGKNYENLRRSVFMDQGGQNNLHGIRRWFRDVYTGQINLRGEG